MAILQAEKIVLISEDPKVDTKEDDLSRSVFGIFGIPIDAVGMNDLLRKIEYAATRRDPFFISTPNLNFVVQSLFDSQFRESLLRSDLCVVDGAPIVWAARVMRIPIGERVAGSDIFDALKSLPQRIRGFLFGGQPGVAAAAATSLNAHNAGMYCTGALCPGFGSVDDMSDDRTIGEINASDAQFLIASLGAAKGQAWLLRNHERLTVPIRAHLGAAINFQGGLLRRAPPLVRRSGLEWLWRIKEEPKLWTRYLKDGCIFLLLLIFTLLPCILIDRFRSLIPSEASGRRLWGNVTNNGRCAYVTLGGVATIENIEKIQQLLRAAASFKSDITVDLSEVTQIDARFIGICLMLRKQLGRRDGRLRLVNVTNSVDFYFRLNRFGFLLQGT